MPELPEVETMRRGIAAVAGCRIVQVERPRCRLRPIEVTPPLANFRRRTRGATIVAVGRVGKRVLLELDTADRIVIEPRMTGLVLLSEPPNREHLRFRIELAGHSSRHTPCAAADGTRSVPATIETGRVGQASSLISQAGSLTYQTGRDRMIAELPRELLFWDRRGLGLVRLCSPAEFEERYGPHKLGPDALLTSPELLRERLGRSRRPIKVALLDQQAVAGIGNLYASEILHLARLHPALPCHRLKAEHWRRLYAALMTVLENAILHEGSTLSDGTYRNALNQAGSYQSQHRVYDRAGDRCLSCGEGEIIRVVQAQRSTFFCSKCQPRGLRRK